MWEVQTFTICDGWVNTWTEDGKPQVFDTREEAQAALDEFIIDTQIEALEGNLPEPYDPADYRIVKVNS